MRLDKLLTELNIGSRSEVKKFIIKGQIKVNGQIIKKADAKVDENADTVEYQGKEYKYRPFRYFVMNKPAGLISATFDKQQKTVIDLFKELTENAYRDEFFPVGRLDKDTEGLLLITNNGELAHRLLSSKYHVEKKYFVRLKNALDSESISVIEKGIEFKDFTSKEAKISDINNNGDECCISIYEGKFHEVKRLFAYTGNEVIYLKRIVFGPILLDEKLSPGQIRELDEKETEGLLNV